MVEQTETQEIFSGLRALVESTFPKRCSNCGREYKSSAEFIAATCAVQPNCSGLKQSMYDYNHPIIEVFRNCACGSTLMENFSNRRDLSEAGIKRRQLFGEMLQRMVTRGVARQAAYAKLIKVIRNQPSEFTRLARTMIGCPI